MKLHLIEQRNTLLPWEPSASILKVPERTLDSQIREIKETPQTITRIKRAALPNRVGRTRWRLPIDNALHFQRRSSGIDGGSRLDSSSRSTKCLSHPYLVQNERATILPKEMQSEIKIHRKFERKEARTLWERRVLGNLEMKWGIGESSCDSVFAV